MQALGKDDDVTKYVIRRSIEKNGKTYTKAPKIQRLVTDATRQRKRHRLALKKRHREKTRQQAQEYAKMLSERNKEKRQAQISKKRQQAARLSQKSTSSTKK